jgi:ABC-2 type transport system permease protein
MVARWHIDSLYMANPLVHFSEAFRNLLYEHQLPSLTTVGVVVGAAAVSLVVGWSFFTRFSKRLAEEL